MKPLWVKLMCGALIALFGAVDTASAAWNNVFQTTCLFRHRRQPVVAHAAPVVVQSAPVVAAAAPACPQPCPPQVQCSTSYVQRCYYQPVTTYQQQTYYEPVTTYRTSYYYEPVTSYTYSCYFDPCTCSYRQVATPVTSYRLRQQSCPVQSWVQRCATVPVTSYQRCCYWQPQTTCCTTTPGAPIAQQPVIAQQPAVVQQQQPIIQQQQPIIQQQPAPNGGPPAVIESQTPGIQQQQPPQQFDRYYGPPQGSQSKQSVPQQNSNPPPQVKLNRIVSNSNSNSSTWVQGQVVRDNHAPQANASLLFVNLDQKSRQTVAANGSGRFNVSLPTGRWAVYMRQQDGREVYHSRIDVANGKMPFITLVSR